MEGAGGGGEGVVKLRLERRELPLHKLRAQLREVRPTRLSAPLSLAPSLSRPLAPSPPRPLAPSPSRPLAPSPPRPLALPLISRSVSHLWAALGHVARGHLHRGSATRPQRLVFRVHANADRVP
jgi:hypothetical protein